MSGPAEPIPTANAEQLEYWSTAGEKWRTYRRQIDRLLSGVTDRLLQRAAPVPGESAIDVGCGAGDTTLRLAATVGEGRVLGIDVSQALLEVAQERARSGGIGNVEFLFADAQVHAFAAGAHDLIASRFGVMFFNDPVTAFGNLARALRPGGRFAFASWGPLSQNPWFLVPHEVAVRHLGAPEPQAPHAPGPMAFADAAYVEGLLTEAGLEAVDVAVELVVLDGGDNAQAAATLSCNLGPASRRIRETGASAEVQNRIAADIAGEFRRYAGADSVMIPAAIHYIAARRA